MTETNSGHGAIRTHILEDRGFPLAVHVAGEGPPLLFGHSLTFDGEMWQLQVPRLADSYRVFALDFRGHGRSTAPQGDFTLDDIVDDVLHIMDHFELDRVGYCGLSMGGMVGLRLALRAPERLAGMVLMSTSANPEPDQQRMTYDMLNDKTRGKLADPAVVEFLMGLMFSQDFRDREPDLAAQFWEKLARVNEDPLYFAVRAVIHRGPLADRLPEIKTPTLVVAAEADASFPVSELQCIADGIPGAHYMALEGAGHMSAVENPDKVSSILRGFFDESFAKVTGGAP